MKNLSKYTFKDLTISIDTLRGYWKSWEKNSNGSKLREEEEDLKTIKIKITFLNLRKFLLKKNLY